MAQRYVPQVKVSGEQKRSFADLKVLLMTFASQMFSQRFQSPLVCEHPKVFKIIVRPLTTLFGQAVKSAGWMPWH